MVIIIMGTTGSGKTTVGELLAHRVGWSFADADDYHSAANKAKMHAGIPLTDSDRIPWLDALHNQIEQWLAENKNVVLACSALKESYRQRLSTNPDVRFVYLKGSYDLIYHRLLARTGHFADEHILAGQFADLEEPANALAVDISGTPDQIADDICARLALACKPDTADK